MKNIKLPTTTEKSATQLELERRIAASLQDEQNYDSQTNLLAEVRKGNQAAIAEVLKASHSLVYKVMQSMPESRYSVEERFNCAMKALEKLADDELNSTAREKFSRFDAYVVKQALLTLENQERVI